MPEDPDSEKSAATTSPAELVAIIRGTANDETVQRVRVALQDGNSEVSRWLVEVESWNTDAFRDARQSRPTLGSWSTRMDAIVDFIRLKRLENVITDEDVSAVIMAATRDGAVTSPPTPSQSLAAAGRMMQAIVRRCPELADEVRGLDQTRREIG